MNYPEPNPELPTLHLPGLFHTINDTSSEPYNWSHCAFTGKCTRFPKMMRPLGWKVIDYSNEGSLSEANEHVTMLTREEFDSHYPRQSPKDFHGSYATIGARGWPIFDQRLKVELSKRVKPHDIVLHPFGRAHADLVQIFPQATHIEGTGIGYPDHPFGAYRVFESEVWRHYHWGRDDVAFAGNPGMNKIYSAVIPNYFDPEDWPAGDGDGDHVLFMGRITPEKGIATIVEIIKAMCSEIGCPRFMFAGQGDFNGLVVKPLQDHGISYEWIESYVKYLGPLHGRARAEVCGRARCMLMPTTFVEPFGGSGVEAMLTGTPLLAQNWGAFTETIIQDVTGYRCRVLGDWINAIKLCAKWQRTGRREMTRGHALRRYSLEACAPQFDAFFKMVWGLWIPGKDWNTREAYNVT